MDIQSVEWNDDLKSFETSLIITTSAKKFVFKASASSIDDYFEITILNSKTFEDAYEIPIGATISSIKDYGKSGCKIDLPHWVTQCPGINYPVEFTFGDSPDGAVGFIVLMYYDNFTGYLDHELTFETIEL